MLIGSRKSSTWRLELDLNRTTPPSDTRRRSDTFVPTSISRLNQYQSSRSEERSRRALTVTMDVVLVPLPGLPSNVTEGLKGHPKQNVGTNVLMRRLVSLGGVLELEL